MTLDEQIRSALRIAKHIAETGGDGLEERQVDEIKALIANQVREARIKEAEYYLRNAAELSLKRTVGVNVIKDRIATLKGDDK